MYGCSVQFIVCGDAQKECDKLSKKNKGEPLNGPVEGAVVSFSMKKYYLFLDHKYVSHNTISHEIFHLVMDIAEDRLIEDQEAVAWLVGYITEEMYKFLKIKSVEIK